MSLISSISYEIAKLDNKSESRHLKNSPLYILIFPSLKYSIYIFKIELISTTGLLLNARTILPSLKSSKDFIFLRY